MAARKAMLLDVSKCTACRGCQVACKQWNQLPAEKTKFTGSYQNPPHLTGNTWTLIQFIEPEAGPLRWLFRKQQCLHCGDSSCQEVCPTGAIKQRKDGIVYIDQAICAGCKNCVVACPFNIPKADHTTGTARKCRLCLDRVENGLTPACAKVCPTDAVLFGTRSEMIKLGKKRVAELAKANPNSKPRLYGETELGGLGVMYVLPEKASVYGLPEQPKKPTARVLMKWLAGIVPGLAFLYGIRRYMGNEPEEANVSASPTAGEGGQGS